VADVFCEEEEGLEEEACATLKAIERHEKGEISKKVAKS
jgi:hypothetical protein